ncbi:hypothetical protein KKH36_02220 [Patescibacteria group bacterium]|nr:hypothetical protein [Patescibacteria group bacterium]
MNKNIKIIIIGIFLITVLSSYYLNNNKKEISTVNKNKDLSLEDQAKLEGKDISEFTPEPTDARSLEEIISKTIKTDNDLYPQDTYTPTLEEIVEKEGKDISEFTPEPSNVDSF